jgi:hypothetical protein
LDINSTRTGVAFSTEENSLSPHFASWRMSGGSDLPRACAEIMRSLRDQIGFVKPKIVSIEAPLGVIDRHHSARAVEVLMPLAGAAMGCGHSCGCRVIMGKVGEVRRYFIDSGNLSSDEAERRIAAKCRALNWGIDNHDEGDAAALWAWTMQKLNYRWAPNGTVMFGKRLGTIQ